MSDVTLPAGTVLRLKAGDWKYGDRPLLLRVERVRDDLSKHYGGAWVWIVGQRLATDGTPMSRFDALVRTAAIADAVVSRPPT